MVLTKIEKRINRTGTGRTLEHPRVREQGMSQLFTTFVPKDLQVRRQLLPWSPRATPAPSLGRGAHGDGTRAANGARMPRVCQQRHRQLLHEEEHALL